MRYDGKKFNHFTEKEGLSSNSILAIAEHRFLFEKERSLWFGTNGAGLTRYDGKTFCHYTEKEGLPNDVVYGILSDQDGNLWGSTNRGLFCLITGPKSDSKQWAIRKFTKADGLQDDEFNTGSYARLPDGRLAFGGVNGLNVFDPKSMLAPGFRR